MSLLTTKIPPGPLLCFLQPSAPRASLLLCLPCRRWRWDPDPEAGAHRRRAPLPLSKAERDGYSILFRLKLGLNQWIPAGGVPVPGTVAGLSPEAAKLVEEKEKSAFDTKLEKFDAAATIMVIKEVRSFTDLGLKKAKELVEKIPVVLKKRVTIEEAEPIAAKLKEVGATVGLERRRE